MALDRHQKLKLYGLSSEESQKILIEAPPEILALDSIILYQKKKIYVKSEAIFQIFKILGGGFQVFLAFKIIPIRFWDKIYDFIARIRYRIFGKRKSCYLPKNQD